MHKGELWLTTVGVAGNNHCPHCRDCSLGRSQAAWAESPEEEGRTAGPDTQNISSWAGGEGTAALNLQTSLSGMLHPATSSSSESGTSTKAPGSAPLLAGQGSLALSWGLAGYTQGQEHTVPTGPWASSMAPVFMLFLCGWALSFLDSGACHSGSPNGSETAQRGSSTRFSRAEPHSNPCWLSQLTGS